MRDTAKDDGCRLDGNINNANELMAHRTPNRQTSISFSVQRTRGWHATEADISNRLGQPLSIGSLGSVGSVCVCLCRILLALRCFVCISRDTSIGMQFVCCLCLPGLRCAMSIIFFYFFASQNACYSYLRGHVTSCRMKNAVTKIDATP